MGTRINLSRVKAKNILVLTIKAVYNSPVYAEIDSFPSN